MKRYRPYLIGASCGAVALGAVLWLIHIEARQTRETIREAARQDIRDGIVEGAERAVDRVADLPGRLARDLKDSIFGQTATPESGGSDQPTNEGRSGQDPQPLLPRMTELIGNVAKVSRTVAGSLDQTGLELLGLTVAEESDLGDEFHKIIVEDCGEVSSPKWRAEIDSFAHAIGESCLRKGLAYRYTILPHESVNAFSHLGGYVYVNKGLLDWIDQMGELEFVLAHEVAHIELKHCVEKLTYAVRAGQLTGKVGRDIVQQMYNMIAVGYSQGQEFEADEWAYRALLRQGRTRDGALAMLRQLHESEAARIGQRDSAAEQYPPNVLGTVVQTIDNHFQSHPAAAERIRRLENLKP